MDTARSGRPFVTLGRLVKIAKHRSKKMGSIRKCGPRELTSAQTTPSRATALYKGLDRTVDKM